tara:strand:+ start:18210 stop:18611 length:402 start_codon:yes stop_codon:yes gene_type:complete
MKNMPFPSNENAATPLTIKSRTPLKTPWKKVGPGEPPPMMLQFITHDGRVKSFACSDIREMQKRDAGHVELSIYGMEKYRVAIEGRHLGELFDLLQMGRIKSMTELGPRTFDHPEESPAIDKITVETLTGPVA